MATGPLKHIGTDLKAIITTLTFTMKMDFPFKVKSLTFMKTWPPAGSGRAFSPPWHIGSLALGPSQPSPFSHVSPPLPWGQGAVFSRVLGFQGFGRRVVPLSPPVTHTL